MAGQGGEVFDVVDVEFRNFADQPIQAFIVELDGSETAMSDVPGQSSLSVQSWPGIWWRFRLGDEVLAEYQTGLEPQQTIGISGPDFTVPEVAVDFQNAGSDPVDVYAVAETGEEGFVLTLPPAQAVVRASPPDLHWSFKRGGQIIADYIADNRAFQEFVLPAR